MMSMLTKYDNPVRFFGDSDPVLQTYAEILHLKHLYRQGWLRRGIAPGGCESVAEHSYGVAMLAALTAIAWFPELDLHRVILLALVHDIGEIYAGDIVPSDAIEPADKSRRERSAVQHIFGKSPQAELLLQVWEDYERAESPEARHVRQIDRLEMAMQARVYELFHENSLEEFYASAATGIQDAPLEDMLESLKLHREQVRS